MPFQTQRDIAQQSPSDDIDESRRVLTSGLVAILGFGALAGCTTKDQDPSSSSAKQSLSGSDQKWVDTVLGPGFPLVRNGDLATQTGPQLSAASVAARGCRTPGDGGGGLFYWDAAGGTDDGGTVIVPNTTVGSTGGCWRRIR